MRQKDNMKQEILDKTTTNIIDSIPESMFYKNIKYLREIHFLSQENIGNIVNKERSVVSLWERNERNPSLDDLIYISYFFKTTIDDLVKCDLKMKNYMQDEQDINDGSKIPVYDYILPNKPLEELKEISWEEIPKNWLSGNRRYFGYKITDSSMMPNYNYDDTVIFEKVDTFDDNKDYLVIVDNQSVAFKRIIKQPYGILLQSLNSNYETRYYNYNDNEELPIKILGVAKEIRRKVDTINTK